LNNPNSTDPRAEFLLSLCLEIDPLKRPSFDQIDKYVIRAPFNFALANNVIEKVKGWIIEEIKRNCSTESTKLAVKSVGKRVVSGIQDSTLLRLLAENTDDWTLLIGYDVAITSNYDINGRKGILSLIFSE